MIKNATQSFVPINEIRNGAVILNNGNMRIILSSSSLNLSLKSEEEQSATISGFQTFLNSLDFPVQIFLESKKLDIRNYLEVLKRREGEVEEDLLKIQIREYVDFIKKFTEEQSIMTKSFYIVVPYDAPSLSSGGSKIMDESEFVKNYNSLMQRVDIVKSTLTSIGLKIENVETDKIVELYYKSFNPNDIDTPEYI
jgi:hypothetical protein